MAWDVAAILALITALIPVVDQVIKWIEKLFPTATGTAKKLAATNVLNAVIPGDQIQSLEGKEVVSKLIDQRVAALNAAGTLKHKGKKKA
jgi:hypothetical protein